MTDSPLRKTVSIEMDDLFEICKAAQGAIELNRLSEKEEAARFILNRAYGHLSPEVKAEFAAYVERKGWFETRPRETIVLN